MKIYLKVYDNESNIVLMPFDTDENPEVPFGDSYKMAETHAEYLSRTKNTMRAYRAQAQRKFIGSVLFR